MNENKNITTEPKKKHVTAKFVVIMIVCMIAGGVFGAAASIFIDNMDNTYASLEQWLVPLMPVVQWVWLGLSALVSVLLYLAARTAVFAYERGSRENEATGERADRLLALGMIANQICMLIGYGLFGIAAALSNRILWHQLVGVLAVFVIIIFNSVYSTYAIKLLKRLYPEKQGHPLSFNFDKEWLTSCDEAERICIYQAAYASYKATNLTLAFVWLVTVLLSMFSALGIYPIIAVTTIWLVHTITYQANTIRRSNRKLER